MRSYWNEIAIPPCTNCGKENGGFMGSTEWGHDHMCCSNACGVRLGQKIDNGMINMERYSFHNPFYPAYEEQINNMRIRIKQLEKQLKKNGIKPVRG